MFIFRYSCDIALVYGIYVHLFCLAIFIIFGIS